MATLSGNKIKDTYQSLVKFSDNGNITTSAKQLTDGFGNNSPMFVSTTQVGIGVTPESGLNLHVYGDAKIGSNLTVIGNLVVEGSTTTVGTDTLTVKDPLIVLANNNTSTDAVDIGFYGKYTPSGTTLYSGLFREALTGKYRLFKGLETEPTTTVNTSGTGYAKADLVIGNLETTQVDLGDSEKIRLGDSQDLEIYHDSFSNYIDSKNNGLFLKSANSIRLYNNTEKMIQALANGEVSLYYDGSLKLSTTSTGVDITGILDVSTSILVGSENTSFTDSGITFKTSGLATIAHNTVGESIRFKTSSVSSLDTVALTIQANSDIVTNRDLLVGGDLFIEDNNKAFFGTGSDLEIYHNGTYSELANNTGTLYIRQKVDDGDVEILSDGGDGTTEVVYFRANGGEGSAQLFHYGSIKLDTSSTGIQVTGEITATNGISLADSVKATFGNSDDLEIYHNGSHSYIDNNTGDIIIRNDAVDKGISFLADDGAGGSENYVYIDGGAFETKFYKDTKHLDNVKAFFGTGEDLQIFHNSQDAYIHNNTGVLRIENDATNQDILFQTTGATSLEEYIRMDGSDSLTKFSKDTMHKDNVKAFFGAGSDLEIYHTGSHSYISNDTGNFEITTTGSLILQDASSNKWMMTNQLGNVLLYSAGNVKLNTKSTGVDITGDLYATGDLEVTGTGQSSFAGQVTVPATPSASTDAASKGYVDSQVGANNELSEVLANGNTTGGTDIVVSSGDNIVFNNNTELRWKDTGSLERTILELTNTDDLYFGGSFSGSLIFVGGGSYTERFRLNDDGNLAFPDNGKLLFGAGSDLEIYHDGSNSYIDDAGTGNLLINANNLRLRDTSGNPYLLGNTGAEVRLYYSGSTKLQTTSTGVDITGAINADDYISIEGATNPYLRIQDTTNEEYLNLYSSDNESAIVYTQDTFKISSGVDFLNQTPRLTINSSGNATFAGAAYFTKQGAAAYGSINLENDDPFIRLHDNGSGSTTDKKKWDIRAIGATGYESFDIRTVNDDNTVFSTKLSIAHGGNATFTGTVTAPEFSANVNNVAALRMKSTTSTIGYGVTNANLVTWSLGGVHPSGYYFRTTGANPAMQIIANGNVGIGTTSPSQKLDVNGAIAIDGTKMFSTIGSVSYIWNNTNSLYVVDDTGNNVQLAIKDNGNVGIGTTSPLQKLHLAESGATSVQLEFSNTNLTKNSYLGINGSGHLILQTNELITFNTGASYTERMRIDSSGNVGIGNTNPSDYSADANNLVVGSLSGNNGITILSASSSGYGSLYFADASTGNKVYSGYIRYQQNQSNMTFGTNEVERMRIDLNGNVGIGTTLPTQKLDVDGSVRIDDVLYLDRIGGAANIKGTGEGHIVIDPLDLSHNVYLSHYVSGNVLLANGGGNVGIGTTSPDSLLNIEGSRNNAILTIGNSTNDSGWTAGDKLGAINFYSADTSGAGSGVKASLSYEVALGTSSATNAMVFRTAGTTAGTNNTERMRIDSSGNVGIQATTIDDGDLQIGDSNSTFNIALAGPRAKFGYDGSNAIVQGGSSKGIAFCVNNNTLSSGEAMRITSAGLVGIGETNPGYRLDVHNGTVGAGIARFSGADSDDMIIVTEDGYMAIDTRNTATGLSFQMQGADKVRILPSGNVGIGTTSPNGKLTIKSSGFGTAYNDYDALYIDNGSITAGNGNYGNGIGFSRLGSPTYKKAAIIPVQGTTDEDNLGLAFFTSPNGGFADVVEEAMRINYNGKVGIGTISPGYTLEIAGPSTTSFAYQRTGVSANKWGFHSDNDATYWQNLTTGNLLFTLQNAGNVGIGTTSPTQKAVISGPNTTPSLNTTAVSSASLLVSNSDTGYGTYFATTGGGIGLIQQRRQSSAVYYSLSLQPYGGNVGIGIDSPQSKLHIGESATIGSNFTTAVNNSQLFVHNVGANTNSNVIFAGGDTGASGGTGAYSFGQNGQGYTHWIFYHKPISTNQSSVGSISSTSTATSYNTSSDYRLKENVVEMTGALDRVTQLKPSRFNFIADADKTVDGFLAHEVQDIVPEAITGEKDAVDEDNNAIYQGIDQSKLVPLLVGAIQELQKRIEILENK